VAVVDGEEPEEEPDSTPPPVPDKVGILYTFTVLICKCMFCFSKA